MFASSTQHQDSYYAQSEQWPEFAPLQDDHDCDVLIIGAGFSGLHTALKLAEAGVTNVTVIEASRIGWAASGRNGGQAILGWSSDMGPIEHDLGYGDALALWQDMEWAAQEIQDLPKRHGFDIDYRSGHLWCSVQAKKVAGLQHWVDEARNKWHYEGLQFIPKAELPHWIGSERYQAAVLDQNGGHLHPLKLCYGMANTLHRKGVRLFEQTRALRYQAQGNGMVVETAQGRISCRQLVLACNAYVDQLAPQLNQKILPVGCFQVATEVLSEECLQAALPHNSCVTDNQFILDYFRRSADNRLLFGGGCTYLGGMPKDINAFMRPLLARVFPQLADVNFEFAWGGHLDCSVRRTPDVGMDGNVYWLQGYSGHGVLPTLAAARAVAEAILGKTERIKRYQNIANPTFWGNETLAAPIEALSKLYFRLRDRF